MKGQKAIFKSQQQCQAVIDSYFTSYLKESGEIADVESLADYLGITRDELNSLTNHRRYGNILKRAKNRIAKIKKQLAFCGKIPAAVLSFDLKNNHGYKDKPEDSECSSAEKVLFKGKAADWAE